MGSGEFRSIPLTYVDRGVYKVSLQIPENIRDIEYYVSIVTTKNGTMTYPPTAPKLNQSVVVIE